jgi:hypothetical protein
MIKPNNLSVSYYPKNENRIYTQIIFKYWNL